MHFFFSTIILMLAMNSCSSASVNNNRSVDSISDSNKETIAQPVEKTPINICYNNETQDVPKIEAVLNKVKGIDNLNERIIAITQEFIGLPYGGATGNVPKGEQLFINTARLDCVTFVETVTAIALAAEEKNPTIEDFAEKLQSIRYRNGKIDGYASRLHYISEWAVDNALRGNLREVTSECGLSEKRVKTIDYMTRNRDLYPALKDEKLYQAIKENEKALKDLRHYIIPTAKVNNAGKSFLKSGDIVAIVTKKPGLDVSHVGVVNVKNGIPYLIHASSKYKKVVNDTVTLQDYLTRQGSPGIRVFRVS